MVKKASTSTGTGVSSQRGGNKPGGGGPAGAGKAKGGAQMPSTAKTSPPPTRKR